MYYVYTSVAVAAAVVTPGPAVVPAAAVVAPAAAVVAAGEF